MTRRGFFAGKHHQNAHPMPQEATTFDIDDTKTVEDNITALAGALQAIDGPLSAVLAPSLTVMSHGTTIDNDPLLDALYAATAPADEAAS
jgi:hypothetical protein